MKLTREKKIDKAKRLFTAGNLKGALGIIKTFPFGCTREEKRVIEIAYESLIGRDAFYQRLGMDTAEMISKSKEIIKEKYNI
ncbi:MAG: hypothetical protein LBH60_04855 [Prevotellaceae bacterium]|jgi:hypothetical protein|nr:hypothetical protein [Prevotellaceae bacterium]